MYDYHHYNSPKKGNRHIYAYGEKYDSLAYCGFIHADNRRQAQTVLNAHNQAWGDDNILLQYSEAECRTEMARRERMQNIEKM